jgi:hypothetical protein
VFAAVEATLPINANGLVDQVAIDAIERHLPATEIE